MNGETGEFWVFGYGSLVWRPGFPFEERCVAVLHGYHRALCVYSHVHRGSPERPGLVLGLDRGGSCRGLAFRVAADRWPHTLDYLRGREQVTMVYRETMHDVRLVDGRRIRAVAYTVDRAHAQYAPNLSDAEIVRLVRLGVGQSGANPEYVRNTHQHLAEFGIHDKRLEWIIGHLQEEALGL
jgi:cation transport protein ChaC